jgi:OOP family OmpA-OmpF porin
MSPNLLELAQNYFLGSTVRQVSTAFGEPEVRISAALRRVVPLVLGGLLARAQEPAGAAELHVWAQQVHQRGLLSDLSSLLSGLRTSPTAITPAAGRLPTRGADMMRALLGANYGPALAGISQQAGVRTTTVSNLFSVAVVAVVGLLGRHGTQYNLDANGLRSYLGSQRDDILGALAALPAGLGQGLARLATGTTAATVAPAPAAPAPSRASPIPMRVVAAPTRHELPDSPLPMRASETALPSELPAAPSETPVTAAQPVVRAAPPQPAGRPVAPAPAPVVTRRWPWLLLLALGLAVAGYLGLSRRPQVAISKPVATPAVPATSARLATPATRVTAPTGRYEAPTGTYRYEVGPDTTLPLPTGTSLTVGSHSAEARLWQLLTDSPQALSVDKTLSGIPLDRVYFDAGKATLTAASQAQLANLAALLAAFPRATLKVGGFTDSQGAVEANLLLSADRANAVRHTLVAQGIAPTRVAAQGYGQTHPVASNTTLAGQAQNRRVAVLLTSH